ncbi:MAG TPA: hypothetical protein VHL08_10815 [Dongiaceae bacterium]|jgi:hypothetical protein|nr:hypothetical protein [Dongiaceae bacterium]
MTTLVNLLSATSRLISCMEEEIALLHDVDFEGVRRIQKQKAALADMCRAFTSALAQTRAGSPLDAALAEKFSEATERCQAAVQQNLHALKAMRDISEKILATIVGTIEHNRAPLAAYDAQGGIHRHKLGSGTTRA